MPPPGIRSKTRLYRVTYVVAAPLLRLLYPWLPKYMTTGEQIGRAMIGTAFNRIYETVGPVKCFLRTRRRALGEGAPFRSIGKGFTIVNPKARLLIVRSRPSGPT